eukprot:5244019-Pyramimonas_sp.AAC.1
MGSPQYTVVVIFGRHGLACGALSYIVSGSLLPRGFCVRAASGDIENRSVDHRRSALRWGPAGAVAAAAAAALAIARESSAPLATP